MPGIPFRFYHHAGATTPPITLNTRLIDQPLAKLNHYLLEARRGGGKHGLTETFVEKIEFFAFVFSFRLLRPSLQFKIKTNKKVHTPPF